eukprot:11138031-Alexandrium_andersonii.AAC.1
MSASLVGSEMCIRDSHQLPAQLLPGGPVGRQRAAEFESQAAVRQGGRRPCPAPQGALSQC